MYEVLNWITLNQTELDHVDPNQGLHPQIAVLDLCSSAVLCSIE